MKSFRDLCHLKGETLWGFTIKPGDVSPVSAFMGYFSSEQEGTRESV